MKFSKNNSKVLVVSHFLINPLENDSAASTAIRNFLLKKVNKIVQIEQYFPESKDKFSYLLIFEDGRLKNKVQFKTIRKPVWLSYIIKPIILLYKLLKTGGEYDLAIVCENLSFSAVLPFRKLGLVKKLIYYSVDYVPRRFGNPLVNFIYHFLDRLACYYSDLIWVVSKEQIRGRFKNGVIENKCALFKVVPIGFRLSEIKVLPVEKVDYYNLVFCGTLRRSAGPQLIIEALPEILSKFPEIKTTFIGGGEYIKSLRKIAKELKVSKSVKFLGRIESHQKLVEILTRGSVGLAPYVPDQNSISKTSDPGKIKLYLACGLPVITTKVATSSSLIPKNKAGIIIEPTGKDLAVAVRSLLGNRKKYLCYKQNAISLSKRFDVDRILTKAFKDLI